MTALSLTTGYLWGSHRASTPVAAGARTLPASLVSTGSGGATSTAGASGITVTGTGTVSGTPDSLRLSLGVSVTQGSVDAALDSANAAASRVQAALRGRGVADKDLQTSGLSIQPQYQDAGGRTTISGYEVSESLTATLRDLKRAGGTISVAAQAGGDATRITGVALDLDNTGPLVTAARAKAFQQARSKAEQYAQASGQTLGRVLSISESTPAPQPTNPALDAIAAASSAKRPVPIAAGSQDVAVTATVVFALG